MTPETPWTDIAAVYIAAIVALITLIYVFLTYQLARAARRQLSSQMMPSLRVQIVEEAGEAMTVILANHGAVSAYQTQMIILGHIDDEDLPFEVFVSEWLRTGSQHGSFSTSDEGLYALRDKLVYDHIPPQTQVSASLGFPAALITNGVTVWLQYTSAVGEVFGQTIFCFPTEGRTRYSSEADPAMPVRQRRFYEVPSFKKDLMMRLRALSGNKTGEIDAPVLSRKAPRYLKHFRQELSIHSVSVGFLKTNPMRDWEDRGDWTLLG